LLVTANIVLSSPVLVTFMMEAPRSSETSVLTRATHRNTPEDGVLHTPHVAHAWMGFAKWFCAFIVYRGEDLVSRLEYRDTAVRKGLGRPMLLSVPEPLDPFLTVEPNATCLLIKLRGT
jgi:hypothetical protein